MNLRPLNVVFGKLSTDFIKIILTEGRQQVKRLIRNNRQSRANKLFHSHLRGTVTERSILQNPSECHWGGRGVGAGEKRFEGVGPPECSPPARRRRAAGEVDGTDESLLSEGASAEAAWP